MIVDDPVAPVHPVVPFRPVQPKPSPVARRVLRSLAPVLVDVVGPLVVFGLLRWCGVEPFPALLAAGTASVLTLVITVVRERRVSANSVLMALLVAVGLAITMATHDPRILLVKASAVFGVIGVTMLGSCVVGRPMFYAYFEAVVASRHPDGAAGFAAVWEGCARFRLLLRRMTAVWGVAWLVESVVRVLIVFAFPVTDVGTALLWCSIAVPVLLTPAMVISSLDGRRLQRTGAAFHAATG